jgi:hypothetical protein
MQENAKTLCGGPVYPTTVRLAIKPKHTIFAVIVADIKKALALKKHTNPAIKVLVEYYKYLDIFL